MKKLFLILPVVLCAVACTQDYGEYDSMLPGCERIETSTKHLVYRCHTDQEWIQSVKQTVANGAFKFGDKMDLAGMFADPDYTYVEIAFDDKGFCAQDFTIRTMVSDPYGETPWAVVGCR